MSMPKSNNWRAQPCHVAHTLVRVCLYAHSRNLLTPIIIHGAWNSTVLTLLFGLAASGVDVETALRELR